jgi:hypothetical protein
MANSDRWRTIIERHYDELIKQIVGKPTSEWPRSLIYGEPVYGWAEDKELTHKAEVVSAYGLGMAIAWAYPAQGARAMSERVERWATRFHRCARCSDDGMSNAERDSVVAIVAAVEEWADAEHGHERVLTENELRMVAALRAVLGDKP